MIGALNKGTARERGALPFLPAQQAYCLGI